MITPTRQRSSLVETASSKRPRFKTDPISTSRTVAVEYWLQSKGPSTCSCHPSSSSLERGGWGQNVRASRSCGLLLLQETEGGIKDTVACSTRSHNVCRLVQIAWSIVESRNSGKIKAKHRKVQIYREDGTWFGSETVSWGAFESAGSEIRT
jgi:hypothetical protein